MVIKNVYPEITHDAFTPHHHKILKYIQRKQHEPVQGRMTDFNLPKFDSM